MSLSKPLLTIVGSYLQNLYLYPIRTKSLTSCCIAASANLTSQLIAGGQFNSDSVLAFGLFGLLFGGTLPHFFYMFLERAFPARGLRFGILRQLLIERLLYTPFFQVISLYMTSRFEGKDHQRAFTTMSNLLKPVLNANWKWLTIFQILNLTVVPPVLRVLYVNMVGFFWVMYMAKVRRDEANSQQNRNIRKS